MDINIKIGLEKIVNRFFDVLEKGVGRATKSYYMRKDADAMAYAMKQLTDAAKYARDNNGVQVEINDGKIVLLQPNSLLFEEPKLLAERASQREEYQQIKEQQNIEQVTTYAAEELVNTVANESEVSDEEVDPDWITRFFDTVKNVSTEDMQRLWGKILAGEIKQPNSFSLRTLDTLKNLSKEEANLFVKIAKLALTVGSDKFVLYHDNGNYLQEEHGIHYTHWLTLQESGLVYPSDNLHLTLSKLTMETEDLPYSLIFIRDKVLIARYSDESIKIRLTVKKFTTIGTQLLQLVETDPDEEYIDKLATVIKSNRDDIGIFIADYKASEGEKIFLENIKEWVE